MIKTYSIKQNYIHRLNNKYFNDTKNTDKWQREVYEFAKKIADENEFTKILDIGTGSAYKLLNNFSDRDTLGIDVEETVKWLRERYPDRNWSSDFSSSILGYDLIIAADVIEHIVDPDSLLNLIENCNPKFAVLSTPDRDLLKSGHNGPPKNQSHVREWSMPELRDYVGSRFEVIEHFISNKKQATQTMLIKLR
jgi:2-polyprenyl-3-methyl-5-hydroxy-6-metoxy-1,4-benzoquinol methylase